ncbi:MAG TPA: IS1595 family transposase [Candidatus Dormibacteraeota bacterium]|nr:IS1595 family transposase [Candidatus Dormibacteraeota bacterium]
MKEAIDLCELVEQFDDDQQCRNYLERLRWPQGIHCPKCGGERVSSILKRDQHNCDSESCGYQFSVTAGTIFHDTHLALTKWFLAVFLLCQSRKGMSANQLKRMLRINYRTAWYLCHRIRHAMAEANPEKLDGTVEMDETYIGGKQRNIHSRGPYGSHKEIVIGIRKRDGDLRFFHASDTRSVTLHKYIAENISEDVDVIMTDEHKAYPTAMAEFRDRHETVTHSKKEYVRGDVHTNTVESAFSLLKRGIVGTWHRVSAKHLAAYLDEMTWRFNNRKNPFLFRDTMLKLIHSDNLEYKELTKAA